jgi:stage V sporulation protein G
MNITEVNIFPRNTDSLLAIAHIIIDGVFIVKSIKIIEGKSGPFISMPNVKNRKGQHRDICHPLNSETRNLIEKKIIDKYNETLANPQSRAERNNNETQEDE